VRPEDQFEMVSHRPYVPEATENLEIDRPNLRRAFVPVNRLTRHWWTIGLPSYLKRNLFDLFHGTNYDIPLRGRAATVLAVHDLSTWLHPETHEARAVQRARRRLPFMARRATMIVTPTESVRREVCAVLKISPDKVVAVPDAQREVFRPLEPDRTAEVRARLGIAENYILCVGTLEPRKNLACLLKAFDEVAASGAIRPIPDLVLTGRTGWLSTGVAAKIDASRFRERIRLTGYVTDEDLRALYSSCLTMIYPSLYEGFGLPPLEAMACGAPVISSSIGSISEVLGRNALLVEPTDCAALARGIIELLTNAEARRRLREAGLAHARSFSWRQTAELTFAIYREALARRAAGG
jgi:glycosyltransferase involved in cell wall biosynthesis